MVPRDGCLWSYHVCSSYHRHTTASFSWAPSLCNDSPSLARLVDLRQSKRVRPAELGLQCSDRPQPFHTLFLPWGLSLILNYIQGPGEGAQHRVSVHKPVCGVRLEGKRPQTGIQMALPLTSKSLCLSKSQFPHGSNERIVCFTGLNQMTDMKLLCEKL